MFCTTYLYFSNTNAKQKERQNITKNTHRHINCGFFHVGYMFNLLLNDEKYYL